MHSKRYEIYSLARQIASYFRQFKVFVWQILHLLIVALGKHKKWTDSSTVLPCSGGHQLSCQVYLKLAFDWYGATANSCQYGSQWTFSQAGKKVDKNSEMILFHLYQSNRRSFYRNWKQNKPHRKRISYLFKIQIIYNWTAASNSLPLSCMRIVSSAFRTYVQLKLQERIQWSHQLLCYIQRINSFEGSTWKLVLHLLATGEKLQLCDSTGISDSCIA